MRKVFKIDNEGYFLEDVIINDDGIVPSGCIEILCPDGFYKPKWNGIEWIEGLTQAEIDSLKNQSCPPSEEDRISAIESAITALMGV